MSNTLSHNVGKSNYAAKKIQPWEIWEEYKLDPWRCDIIKRTLRTKQDDDPVMDLDKIIHICEHLKTLYKKGYFK